MTSRSAENLREDLIELERLSGWIELERARRLAAFEQAGGLDLEGHTSLTAFMKHRCAMATGRAHQTAAMTHRLPELPHLTDALGEGAVSTDQVRVLLAVGERLSEELARDEGMLLDGITGLSVADTGRLLAYWRDAVDGPGAVSEAEDDWRQRYVHASKTIRGMVRLDGFLDPESGEVLLTALAAATPPGGNGDPRTPGQRRADALVDLARMFLDSGQAPGSDQPHMLVLTDHNALQGQPGGVHETASGEVLTTEAVRRIACDATVSRIVFGPDSEPLDIGRATRIVPAPMRRALIARDRHCGFPGCDRPYRWCDAHHLIHWINGGVTALNNLILLCRYHHRIVHEQGFAIHDPPEP